MKMRRRSYSNVNQAADNNKLYDSELTLIAVSYAEDDIGNQIEHKTESVALCCVGAVGRSEFYAAATGNLKPELMLTIHNYEYSGQPLVWLNGVEYTVIRTYATGFEELELTVQRVIANGEKNQS